MAFCLQCNKWVPQIEGKKKRQFCNNTCRSNYWYAKNKKVKFKEPTPDAYDAPKLPSDFRGDEPLSFQKLREQEPENDDKEPTFKELMNGMANIHFMDDKNDYAIKIQTNKNITEKERQSLLSSLFYKP